MTLSGYFVLKSVFGQQGCCALTFASARLSRIFCPTLLCIALDRQKLVCSYLVGL